MGLSVVISGAIIMIALMFVLYSIPPLITSVTSVGETSSEISDLENTILQTEINLDSLVVNSSMPSFTFNLNNINIEKLWDYDNFDVLVTYDAADVSGIKTRVTETVPFNSLNQSYTILDEIIRTSADTTATTAYTIILDMATNVPVEGPESHILFHANITYDSDSVDSSCRTALFIDGAPVAEAEDYVDATTTEPGNAGLTWWETGLAAGNHDFDVRWLEEGGSQTGCIIATDTERSMQVIEFIPGDGVPTILTEVTSLSAESYPTINQSVDGMTDSPTIEGPDSLILTTSTMTFDEDGGGDASCFLGIYIDGTLQAEQQTFTDSLDLPGSVGLMWAETGLSEGSHTIDLQARESQTGCGTDTALQRHMQIVEYTSGNPTILAEETSIAFQSMTPAYVLITTLVDTVTIDGPGSVVLFTATVTFDSNLFRSGGDVALFIDDTMVAEGGTLIKDNVPDEPGHVNLHWWETGLSAGLHTFDVRGKENNLIEPGADTDTATISHMQVIEFPCIKQWNILSITDDVLDPGLINPEETAKISVELCNPIFDNGNVVVSLSTDNGITGTINGIAT